VVAAVATPDVSVVVITRDRRDELATTLTHLRSLPENPPVVVVDNGSGDGTARMVRSRFPEVRLVPLGTNLGGVGRNIGVAQVATPFVAFCDDDTWWEPGALARAASLFACTPALAVVTARITVEPGGHVDAISTEMERSPLDRPPGVAGYPLLSFLAGASVVRRSAFAALGGFSRRFLIGGEEELLAADLADAGWVMTYLPELEIHHRASTARDPHLRRRQGIRNTLWFTWLRRSGTNGLRRSWVMLRTVPRDRVSAGAMVEALRGLPWVVADRRPVGAGVEAGLRLLDLDHLTSEARRYVS